MPSAALAIKVQDSALEPTFAKDSYVYVELNTPLNTKDYGIFSYNGEILIRRFYSKMGKIILKVDNKEYQEIQVKPDDEFYIIGKVLRVK